MSAQSEAIRRKYLYRRLIMRQKVKLHHKAARGLVGPDCAYHLYRQFNGKADQSIPRPEILRPDEMEPDAL